MAREPSSGWMFESFRGRVVATVQQHTSPCLPPFSSSNKKSFITVRRRAQNSGSSADYSHFASSMLAQPGNGTYGRRTTSTLRHLLTKFRCRSCVFCLKTLFSSSCLADLSNQSSSRSSAADDPFTGRPVGGRFGSIHAKD